jgi:Mg2+ and Co2+ transporter CorA
MIHRHTKGTFRWVDLESPTTEEVRELMDEFSLDPQTAEDLLSPTLRPHVDSSEGYFYLVLHFPALKHSHTQSQDQEIDFIVGKDWIVTTRYDTIDPLNTFSKEFEVGSLLGKTVSWDHAGHLFYFMLSRIYAAIGDELEHLDDRLESAELNIFEGKEKEMVIELSRIGRDLLNLKAGFRIP